MYDCVKRIYRFLPGRKGGWRQLRFPQAMLLALCLISGCSSTSSSQQYENTELGIRLERPGNWDLIYHERSGSVVLDAENRLGNKDSAHVEIYGNACVPAPAWFQGSRQEIYLNIDRIRILYNLDSVKIIQEPSEIEAGLKEIIKAIIIVPTMSLPENSVRNQVGGRDPDLFQTIVMFAIKSENHFVMAYVYEGGNNELNAEAEAIVTSIQFMCSK